MMEWRLLIKMSQIYLTNKSKLCNKLFLISTSLHLCNCCLRAQFYTPTKTFMIYTIALPMQIHANSKLLLIFFNFGFR